MTISADNRCSFKRQLQQLFLLIGLAVFLVRQFTLLPNSNVLGGNVVFENVKKEDEYRNDNIYFVTRFQPGLERWDPPQVDNFLRNNSTLPREIKTSQDKRKWLLGADDFLEKTFFQKDDSSSEPLLRAPSSGADDSHLVEMLGFLRIPKTGSTSLYQTMMDARQGPHFGCFRGPYNVKRSTYPSLSYGPAKDCAHFRYDELTLTWIGTFLPLLCNNSISQEPMKKSTYYSLQLFSMVRDPFDRMISLFNYMKKVHPEWSRWLDTEQVSLMKNGDVGGFLKYLYRMKSTRTLQFVQFHNNLEKATRLISGSHPRIFTTVNECFEASLLLLQERFPRFVSPKMIRSYTLASHQQRNKNSVDKPVPMNATLKASLRQQVKVWFPKDFKFYNITVEQFRMHLASSSINATVVESCLRTLDRRAPLYT